MRGLIAFLFLLKSSFASNIILTDYWNGEDPAKAKEACMNDPTSFTFTLTSPSQFITGVDDNEVCNMNGTDCQWSGIDTCYYWKVFDGEIIYQDFTYSMQDENDIAAWAVRPFCDSASHDMKRLESGDCFNSEVGTMEVYKKASIPRESKSCTLVEEMYKNKACTHPANAFALHYEFDMNECFVYADFPNGILAMNVSKVNDDVYQIQSYKDPNCILDPDHPVQYLKIGECQPNFADDDDTPFKTWTKVLGLKCDDEKRNQNSEYIKSSNYTSFTRLMKKGIRNAKLKRINL